MKLSYLLQNTLVFEFKALNYHLRKSGATKKMIDSLKHNIELLEQSTQNEWLNNLLLIVQEPQFSGDITNVALDVLLKLFALNLVDHANQEMIRKIACSVMKSQFAKIHKSDAEIVLFKIQQILQHCFQAPQFHSADSKTVIDIFAYIKRMEESVGAEKSMLAEASKKNLQYFVTLLFTHSKRFEGKMEPCLQEIASFIMESCSMLNAHRPDIIKLRGSNDAQYKQCVNSLYFYLNLIMSMFLAVGDSSDRTRLLLDSIRPQLFQILCIGCKWEHPLVIQGYTKLLHLLWRTGVQYQLDMSYEFEEIIGVFFSSRLLDKPLSLPTTLDCFESFFCDVDFLRACFFRFECHPLSYPFLELFFNALHSCFDGASDYLSLQHKILSILHKMLRRIEASKLAQDPSAATSQSSSPIKTAQTHKKHLQSLITDILNSKPSAFIKKLRERYSLLNQEQTDIVISRVLRFHRDVNQEKIISLLTNEKRPGLLPEYVKLFNFEGMRIESALRFFLSNFLLRAEPGQIQKVLGAFSHKFFQDNKDQSPDLFPYDNPDTVWSLSLHVVFLNTNLHHPNVKEKDKMKEKLFVDSCISTSSKITPQFASQIFKNVAEEEIALPLKRLSFNLTKYTYTDLQLRAKILSGKADNTSLNNTSDFFDFFCLPHSKNMGDIPETVRPFVDRAVVQMSVRTLLVLIQKIDLKRIFRKHREFAAKIMETIVHAGNLCEYYSSFSLKYRFLPAVVHEISQAVSFQSLNGVSFEVFRGFIEILDLHPDADDAAIEIIKLLGPFIIRCGLVKQSEMGYDFHNMTRRALDLSVQTQMDKLAVRSPDNHYILSQLNHSTTDINLDTSLESIGDGSQSVSSQAASPRNNSPLASPPKRMQSTSMISSNRLIELKNCELSARQILNLGSVVPELNKPLDIQEFRKLVPQFYGCLKRLKFEVFAQTVLSMKRELSSLDSAERIYYLAFFMEVLHFNPDKVEAMQQQIYQILSSSISTGRQPKLKDPPLFTPCLRPALSVSLSNLPSQSSNVIFKHTERLVVFQGSSLLFKAHPESVVYARLNQDFLKQIDTVLSDEPADPLFVTEVIQNIVEAFFQVSQMDDWKRLKHILKIMEKCALRQRHGDDSKQGQFHSTVLRVQKIYLTHFNSSLDLFLYLVYDLLHNLQFFISYDQDIPTQVALKRLQLLEGVYSQIQILIPRIQDITDYQEAVLQIWLTYLQSIAQTAMMTQNSYLQAQCLNTLSSSIRNAQFASLYSGDDFKRLFDDILMPFFQHFLTHIIGDTSLVLLACTIFTEAMAFYSETLIQSSKLTDLWKRTLELYIRCIEVSNAKNDSKLFEQATSNLQQITKLISPSIKKTLNSEAN